jgi:transcriptional regulator of arginine metabolism
MTREARHYAIKEILGQTPIANQEDLRLHLQRKGFKVTQATLSRDMKQMGVARVVARGKTAYAMQPAGEAQMLRPIIGAEVLSMEANESLIIVRTVPGAANTVGEFIDLQDTDLIMGTVAGDNTLLIIPRSQKSIQRALKFLKNILIEGKQ